MTSITNSFRLHVDPSLYAFKWKDAEYVTVYYNAVQLSDNIIVTTDITGSMYLLSMIVVAEKWVELNKEVNAAAKAHAAEQFSRNGQVDETIMSAIAPHII